MFEAAVDLAAVGVVANCCQPTYLLALSSRQQVVERKGESRRRYTCKPKRSLSGQTEHRSGTSVNYSSICEFSGFLQDR